MTVSVVVPLDEARAQGRPWLWLKARYALLHPSWEVVEGYCAGEWRKGVAVADGLSRASGEVVVVADADSWCSQAIIEKAVEYAQVAPWVMPHGWVERITEQATTVLLARPPINTPTRSMAMHHDAPVGGGIVVGRREVLDDVPLDPRFQGWGGDDISWGRALDTLTGPHVSLDAPLWHLDHRPQPNRRHALPETETLANRYMGANGDPEAMRALIDEARAAMTVSPSL